MLMPAKPLNPRGLLFLCCGEREVTQHHQRLSVWDSQDKEKCKGNDILTVTQYCLVQCCVPPEPSRACRVGSCARETLNYSPSSSFLYGSE